MSIGVGLTGFNKKAANDLTLAANCQRFIYEPLTYTEGDVGVRHLTLPNRNKERIVSPEFTRD